MFVKLVYPEGEHLFECDSIKYDANSFIYIERGKKPFVTIHKYDDYKSLCVYIMNDNGKTIDYKVYNRKEQIEQ